MSQPNSTHYTQTAQIADAATTSAAICLGYGRLASVETDGNINAAATELLILGCGTEGGTYKYIYDDEGNPAKIILHATPGNKIYSLSKFAAVVSMPFLKLESDAAQSGSATTVSVHVKR